VAQPYAIVKTWTDIDTLAPVLHEPARPADAQPSDAERNSFYTIGCLEAELLRSSSLLRDIIQACTENKRELYYIIIRKNGRPPYDPGVASAKLQDQVTSNRITSVRLWLVDRVCPALLIN
jgi:hypothetical protein